MLTRAEEDVAILESEEKNDLILFEWAKGKEGNRNVRDSGQVEGASEGAAGAQVVPTTQNAQV